MKDFIRPIFKNIKALIGFIFLSIFILMASIGPLFIPLNLTSNFAERYQPPSLKHPYGTDYFGIDIFQQIVHGARSVIGLSVLASLFAVIIGSIVGIIRGYLGGVISKLLDTIITIFLVIPSFPALLIMAAIFSDKSLNIIAVALIIAMWLWAPLAKQISAQVLSIKSKEFIETSRMLNLGTPYILFKDIMPLLIPYIFINFITQLKGAMEFSVGLMFLGLAKFDPTHWGVMLNYALYQAGALYTPRGFHYPVIIMLHIILLIYGGILFAQGIEEVYNPKLRRYE
jgi:peptide/nickel transport system permease protein